MGRAQGGTRAAENPFAAALGHRRGSGRVTATAAVAAMKVGDLAPARAYVNQHGAAAAAVLVSLAGA